MICPRCYCPQCEAYIGDAMDKDCVCRRTKVEKTKMRISKKQLETIGSASITGMLLTQKIIPNERMEIVLEFEQSSRELKEKNNGPDLIIIPEHVVMCICDDIVSLMARGYRVTITEYSE